MPSFNPFSSVVSRNACTLFEIRLDSSFLVFRGNEHEANGQVLKGCVVLCLREPLKVEDVHLRLTGNCRLAWTEAKQTPTGVHNQKVDRTVCVLRHNWAPFVGGDANHHKTLAPGNYEWPFELTLPGETSESVEGMNQTMLTYLLKATVSRGKLAKNLHAFKRMRVIRTLEPAALEFNHAMSVENIWPNKIEYSVVIPQKAIVFGSHIPMEMRFTPLLKGLELGNIAVKLIEIQDFTVASPTMATKHYKHERDVKTWNFEVSHEEHWRDNIEETGQEGWLVNRDMPLPRKLTQCVQDCHVHGIKIRHKVKLTVGLKNPDGHISELRATLPVTIFISPNMPLDDDGNLVSQQPDTPGESTNTTETTASENRELSNMAPPGYGQHVLDQLYEGVDPGIMTPGGPLTASTVPSGFSSPMYALSRAGSHENLASLNVQGGAVPPAALSSRLQNVSQDRSARDSYFPPAASRSGAATPMLHHPEEDHHPGLSQPHSTELSRRTSEEERSHPNTPPEPEHSEFIDMEQLSKVPSYTTATRTPISRTPSFNSTLGALPDYRTAVSAPSSPNRLSLVDPMSTISEGVAMDLHAPPRPRSPSRTGSNDAESMGFHYISHSTIGDTQGDRRSRTPVRNS